MGIKIKKIEKLNVKEKAYDVSVDSTNHTFQLDNGVFVHNSMKVPKQYFALTNDSTGFNGGTSLSIISSRYAKTIKRIQNVLCQMVTDAINLMLLDKGMDSYINKFTIRMQEPTTQEATDRQAAVVNKMGTVSDVMSLVSDIESPSAKLKILKSLLSNVISDVEVTTVLEEQIELMEQVENGAMTNEAGDADSMEEPGMGGHSAPGRISPSPSSDFGGMEEEPDMGGEEIPQPSGAEEIGELPTPEELGVDMTDNDMEF